MHRGIALDGDCQNSYGSRNFQEFADEEIRRLFGAVLQEALAGRLDAEALEQPLGMLAVLIVLDQFTRNAYRGTPKSFAGDARALQLARQAAYRPPMPNHALRIMEEDDLRSIHRFVVQLGAAGQPAPAALAPGQTPAGPAVLFPAPPAP